MKMQTATATARRLLQPVSRCTAGRRRSCEPAPDDDEDDSVMNSKLYLLAPSLSILRWTELINCALLSRQSNVNINCTVSVLL
jgi:hypothetical protein